MNDLQLVFSGPEFVAPHTLLSALSLEDSGKSPGAGIHSIFEELFHIVYWQDILLERVRTGMPVSGSETEHFPSMSSASSETSWKELIDRCLAGVDEAIALAGDETIWEKPLANGRTGRSQLEMLAVHNAYHFGKIVLLRKLLGCWPPSK